MNHSAHIYKRDSVFHGRKRLPVLVNTSLNVRGEPIVCTPENVFRCFMGTGIEVLVIGNSILYKEDQDQDLEQERNFLHFLCQFYDLQ